MKPFSFRSALQIKASAAGRRFDILAYTGGKLRVDGAPLPVVVDLQGLKASGSVPILVDHTEREDNTLGNTDRIVNDGRSLRLCGPITGADPSLIAQNLVSPKITRVLAMAAAGHTWQASIGAQVNASRQIPAGEVVLVNGQRLVGPFILATDSDLRETSVLPMGADKNTHVNLAAAAAGLLKGTAMKPSFEEWVKSQGFELAQLNETQRGAFQATYDQLYPAEAVAGGGTDTAPAKKPDETPAVAAAAALDLRASATAENQRILQERREMMAAEETRITQIRAACATDANIMATAIRDGWTAERAELAMLRAAARSGQAPAGHSRSHDGTCTLQALQGAMILRAGGRLDNPHYATPRALAMGIPQWLRAGLNNDQRQQAMEAAHRYRDLSMVDLAREACRLDGVETPHGRGDMIRAAFSGGSLTNIFTSNVNTRILSTYEEAGDTTAEWTSETEVADFKTNERPRMTKSPDLAKLPPGGTADHLNRGDVGESYKIARYAKQMVIDEQDIINDSFQALADTPREMGLAAARLRPNLVYAILLANPTLAATGRALFNSTDANLATTAALAAPKLKSAIAAMALFQENGVNLNLQATHLIVPPTLKWTAKELLNSTALVLAGTAGTVTERGSNNTLADEGLKWVSDARLENGVTDPDSGTVYAGSASTWFLACALAHVIEVAYLRGTGRAPQVRSFKLDRGQWGVGWDVNMDIGAKALDWKGLYQSQA